MQESNLPDEPALSPEDFFASDEAEKTPEIAAPEVPVVEEKKPRGRPKKTEVVSDVGSGAPSVAVPMVDIKSEQAKLAAELVAQKAHSKAQPFLKQWEVTVGRKIIRYTRTHNGNVFREFVGNVVGKKKRA